MHRAREAAVEIVRALQSSGHQAYLVGGCVRDVVMGRDPADFDVTTSATPEQVMALFPHTYAVGAQFGVVLVPYRLHDDPEGEVNRAAAIEVATFRSDIGYSDGRHPDEVRFSSDPREDVQRRDFTINGLLMDPVQGDRVLDFVGGMDDIAARVLRTIGDPHQRFTEDKLRMLRAVRFTARFGYAMDAATMRAIQSMAASITQVSCERIRDEISKMLTEGQARRAFELLDESGLLPHVLPEVARYKGVEQPPEFHPEGDVWVHTLLLLEGLPAGCSKTLGWGALLHDVGKPATFRRAPDRIRFDGHVDVGVKMAEEICRRLRFSNGDTAQICALVQNHMRFADVKRMKESTLKRFLRVERFDEHLALHRLDCLASHGHLDLYEFARERWEKTPPEQVRPAPLLTGHDLLAAGYKQGPEFKAILAAVEDAQLDGALHSREQALEFVRREFGKPAIGSKQ